MGVCKKLRRDTYTLILYPLPEGRTWEPLPHPGPLRTSGDGRGRGTPHVDGRIKRRVLRLGPGVHTGVSSPTLQDRRGARVVPPRVRRRLVEDLPRVHRGSEDYPGTRKFYFTGRSLPPTTTHGRDLQSLSQCPKLGTHKNFEGVGSRATGFT